MSKASVVLVLIRFAKHDHLFDIRKNHVLIFIPQHTILNIPPHTVATCRNVNLYLLATEHISKRKDSFDSS